MNDYDTWMDLLGLQMTDVGDILTHVIDMPDS